MPLSDFRPRSATELVDAAVQLARRHYGSLITLGAAIAIPNLVLGLGMQWLMPTQPNGTLQMAYLAGFAPLYLISIAWTFVGFGAFVASAAAAYVDGAPLEPLRALRAAVRRAVSLVGGNLLAMLFVFLIVGAVIFGIAIVLGIAAAATGRFLPGATSPGLVTTTVFGVLFAIALIAALLVMLVVWARFINISAVVMLEGLGAAGAVRRSRELVRGHAWRVSGVLLLMGVFWGVAYATVVAVASLASSSWQISANVASLLTVLLYPFFGCLITLLYYDLRIRREGYDLELMARSLESPDGAESAAPEPAV